MMVRRKTCLNETGPTRHISDFDSDYQRFAGQYLLIGTGLFSPNPAAEPTKLATYIFSPTNLDRKDTLQSVRQEGQFRGRFTVIKRARNEPNRCAGIRPRGQND